MTTVTNRAGKVRRTRKFEEKERSAPLKLPIRDRLPKSKALAMLAVWRWSGRFLVGELMPNTIQRLENGLNPGILQSKSARQTPEKLSASLRSFWCVVQPIWPGCQFSWFLRAWQFLLTFWWNCLLFRSQTALTLEINLSENGGFLGSGSQRILEIGPETPHRHQPVGRLHGLAGNL